MSVAGTKEQPRKELEGFGAPKELLVARVRWAEKLELSIDCQRSSPTMQELPRTMPAQLLQMKGQRRSSPK